MIDTDGQEPVPMCLLLDGSNFGLKLITIKNVKISPLQNFVLYGNMIGREGILDAKIFFITATPLKYTYHDMCGTCFTVYNMLIIICNR